MYILISMGRSAPAKQALSHLCPLHHSAGPERQRHRQAQSGRY